MIFWIIMQSLFPGKQWNKTLIHRKVWKKYFVICWESKSQDNLTVINFLKCCKIYLNPFWSYVSPFPLFLTINVNALLVMIMITSEEGVLFIYETNSIFLFNKSFIHVETFFRFQDMSNKRSKQYILFYKKYISN